MTLIIGIKCQDGIILAADSASTAATGQGRSTTTINSNKLNLIGNDVVVGVSGPLGITQNHVSALSSELSNKGNSWPAKWDLMKSKKTLERLLWRGAEDAWKRVDSLSSEPLKQFKLSECAHSTLVAFPCEDEPRLFEFTDHCNGEEKTVQNPFVAIGSGQAAADPYLRFIWDRLWERQVPELSDGLFAAVWTLNYVIEHSASGSIGVGGPINAAQLTSNDDNEGWQALCFAEEEVEAQLENGKALEENMRDFLSSTFNPHEVAPGEDIP